MRAADWVTVGTLTDKLRRDPEGWRVVARRLEATGGATGVGKLPQWDL